MDRYGAEALVTFILVFCGTGAIIVHQKYDGAVTHVGICLVFGLVVALLAVMGGPVSGTSLNPVRSLAPALVSGQLQHMWLYALAPAAGVLLGVGASRLLATRPAA